MSQNGYVDVLVEDKSPFLEKDLYTEDLKVVDVKTG